MEEIPKRSRTMRLRAWGPNACFTRPEMKVERVSYDVMTPSAARGILEAIHWKPAIRWQVERIDVLKPIRWESVRRNEIGHVMAASKGIFIDDIGNDGKPKYRLQRAGLLLRDVDYIVHAHFEMTDQVGTEDTVVKHEQMFWRRAEKGQAFHRPYFGCREFAADFALVPDAQALPEPVNENRELGYMLHDICHDNTPNESGSPHFCNEKCQPRFFKAALKGGRLKVPPLNSREVRA
ncbi:MAG: type I-C CRISPR-associated protein Cas5c [Dehalococcoidia bacterium]|nr:type I-C CRISPR-associated protein Cas5c [Dehalococcoidia bacterium]